MSDQSFVIYRKYRPQSFSEVISQEHIIETLRNSIVNGKIAHAYLFSGPRGCGKTSIARILSKSANCTGRENSPEPCNKCQNCSEFNSGRSLDLIEIDAASNRGIDEIKNLRENVRFGPSSGKYKVYLIDEAHMLTPPAFNAFLKTLEEPPSHAVFILATTEASRIPATIISRTQRFDFKRLPTNLLASRLKLICESEKIKVDPEALLLIASEADGSSRDAESMLGQILATGEKNISLETAEEMLGLFSHRKVSDLVDLAISGERAQALNWLQKNMEAGSDVGQLLKSVNHYLRKLVMVGMSPELAKSVKQQISEKDFEMLQRQAGKKSPAELAGWLKTFSEAKKNLDHYPLPQMAVEIALINLITEKTDSVLNPIPKTLVDSGSDDSDILENIRINWNKIVNEVRPHNHSLFGCLQTMKPKLATDTTFTISTKYGFHKDRISEIKNKKIVEDAVEKVIGRHLSITCELEK